MPFTYDVKYKTLWKLPKNCIIFRDGQYFMRLVVGRLHSFPLANNTDVYRRVENFDL